MSKQLNVSVAVTADTSAAKAQLQSLQTTLQQLSTSSTNLHLGLNTSELNKAISDVDKLQAHLKNATNANGMLDFSKLNNSIKASGSSLTEYGNQLLKLGPQGQQAFNQLTQAVAKSTIPVSRMKGLLGEFGTVLGNTIKWQAASSAIHGMMGSIQHAFSYAQQLNKSLNNIQIVTGLGDDKMAKFAENANKAAKSLSTTTTSYTDAALIYYQQGIRDQDEIAKRVETTIKLANVSGQSAEKVSDQMTAIWNNFAKGGDNLEYYADVITALGAATASSSEEIATGLSKFAAVADTVGLSYENATAALATITATTRQSADTVGTGLRTLFARLQSLNLGETLDDGVTLTKYTKALDKIGVSVIDATGQMRSMDAILDDMGQKWQTLTDAQKTATAQTVGGVRQYTTLMALMENYDFYKENQKVATNAEGTVQAQADIYAKSWEAAQKRVKASAESIYSDLINDDFFISLNNGLAGFLNLLDQIIDGMGGLKTLLPMIGAAMTAAFSDKATLGLMNLSNNLRMLAPGAAKRDRIERDAFLDQALKIQTGYDSKNYKNLSSDQKLQYDYAKRDLEFQRAYANNSRYMTSLDQMMAQSAMDKYSNLRNAYMQNSQQLATSRYNKAEAQSNMIGVNGTKLNIFTKQADMDKGAQQQYNQALEFARLAAGIQNGTIKPNDNSPKYFTDKGNGVGTWFASNGQFLKTNYDTELENSGDVKTLTKDLSRLDHQARFLKEWEQAGDQGSKTALGKLKTSGFDMSRISNFYDKDIGKITNFDAMRQEIGALTAEQDKMVTDFAAKWGKSKEAVMKYKDAIIATNGDTEKRKELEKQMLQADKAAEKSTQKDQQVQRAQNVVKYAQAMQGAVAAGQSFAAVTQNIATNLENGGSIFDNFGQTLSGITSGFMSASMVIAAMPNPIGIAIAAISSLIGVLSQIPAVTDFFHKLFTSDDQLVLENLQKNAELIQSDFEEAKQKADEFLNATGTHNQLLEEINKCIRGTQEFKEAIIEANSYARQMMNDYNLSLDDIIQDENGTIKFKDGVIEAKQRALEANRDNLELMQAYSGYEVQRKKYDIAQKELSNMFAGPLYTDGKVDTSRPQFGFNLFENDTKVQDLIQSYLESGYTSFEEYYQDRGGRISGLDNQYEKIQSVIADLGYESIDDYITAIKDYGQESANSLKFDGIVSDLFENIATSKIFGENANLDLSKFLATFLGTGENGELIQQASLSDWMRDHKEQQSELYAALNANGVDFQGIPLDQLMQNTAFLKTFLTTIGNFDASELAKMDDTTLKEYAQSFLSAQKGIKIFEDNYKALATDKGVQYLSEEVSKKGQKDQQKSLQYARERIEQYRQEDNTYDFSTVTDQSEQAILAYYENWIKNFETAKAQMVDNVVELFSNDSAWTDKEDSTHQEELTERLRTAFKTIIENSSLTDAEVAEALNLGSQIKNVLGEAFSPEQFRDLFIKSDLTDMYKSIDWTSPLSAFFDIASIKDRIGDSGTEISIAINDLYTTLLDENHLNGKQGLLSQIFQEEEFQKELKSLQKEFKKTGKISDKSLESLIGSCEDLNEVLDLGVLSAGAVADAIELYSMGAITNIDDITNNLLEALEVANELRDVTEKGFKHIDEFNPDRSVKDIDDSYSNWAKEMDTQLSEGLTGENRTYQIAEFLGGPQLAHALETFFFNLETEYVDKPTERYSLEQADYEAYQTMLTQMQEEGSFRPWWEFMLSGKGDALYGKDSNIAAKLGNDENGNGLGFSIGDNNQDVELNVKPGMTSNDYVQGLMSILGIDEGAASAIFAEIVGHSEGIRGQIQANEFVKGYDQVAGTAEEENFIKARANDTNIDVLRGALELLYGDDTEKYAKYMDILNQVAEEQEAQRVAREKQNKLIQETFSETSNEETESGSTNDNEQAKIDFAKRVINPTDENGNPQESLVNEGALNYQKYIEEQAKQGLTQQNANEALGAYMEANPGEIKTLTTQYADANGVIRELTVNLEDLGRTPEEQLAKLNKLLEELSTNGAAANQALGKDIFKGMLEGAKELSEQKEEWTQDFVGEDGISIPVTLELVDDFDPASLVPEPVSIPVTFDSGENNQDLENEGSQKPKIDLDRTELDAAMEEINKLLAQKNIPMTITITHEPDYDSDKGFGHVTNDIKDMKEGPISIQIELKDTTGVENLKAAKGDFDGFIAEKDSLSNIDIGFADGVIKSLGETVLEINAILAEIDDTKEIEITYKLPDGTTLTMGQQEWASKTFLPNDQALAQTQYEENINNARWANRNTETGLTKQDFIEAYNAEYDDTGFSVGSIASGTPNFSITDEMIAAFSEAMGEKHTLEEMFNFDEATESLSLSDLGEQLVQGIVENTETSELGDYIYNSGYAEEKTPETENIEPAASQQGDNSSLPAMDLSDLTNALNDLIAALAKQQESQEDNEESGDSEGEQNGTTEVKKATAQTLIAETGSVTGEVHANTITADTAEIVDPTITLHITTDKSDMGDVEEQVESVGEEKQTIPITVDDQGEIARIGSQIEAATKEKTTELHFNSNIKDVKSAVDSIQDKSMQVDVSVSVSSVSDGGTAENSSSIGGIVNAIGQGAYIATSTNPRVNQLVEEKARHHLAKSDVNAASGNVSAQWKGWHWTSAQGGYVQSFVNGSSNRHMSPGVSLTAEEGPEIIWNKQEGYAYLVGGHGHPEFVSLRAGDRVFNANDTRQILNYKRPKENFNNQIKNPDLLKDTLFASHAAGSAYGSYGPESKYGDTSSGGGVSTGGNGGNGSKSRPTHWVPEHYHVITRQIQDLTFWYEQLERARSRAYGVNQQRAIDKEITATKQLIIANRQLVKEADQLINGQGKYTQDGSYRKKLQNFGTYLEKKYPGIKDVKGWNSKKRKMFDSDDFIKFDEAGNIANYEDLQWILELAEGSFRGWSVDTSGGSEDGSMTQMDWSVEAAKELQTLIQEYEAALDKYQEAYTDYTDYMIQLNDLMLEKITSEVEMKFTFNDRDLDILDYYLSKIEDDAYSTAAAISNMAAQLNLTIEKIGISKSAINDLFENMYGENGGEVFVQTGADGQLTRVGEDDKYTVGHALRVEDIGELKTDWTAEWYAYLNEHGDDAELQDEAFLRQLREGFMNEYHLRTLTMEEYIEGINNGENYHIDATWGQALEEQVDNLLDALKTLQDNRTFAADTLTNNYQALVEDIERQVDLFDHYADTLDKLQSITELQGITLPENIKRITTAMNNSLVDVYKANIQIQQSRLNELQNTRYQLQLILAQDMDAATRKIYEDQLNDIEESMNDCNDAILDNWEQGLEAIKNNFESTMDDITKTYEKAISAIYGSTDALTKAIDHAKSIHDQYVDDYEKYYQLTKLERTIGKDIDERANKGIKNNRKLESVLQEINKIRATGQKMSQDELDLLQKQYDLAKAQSDLEDARSAKETVRLQRDRNGNWGYVYTAVEDEATEELEQAVDDALYAYQQQLTTSLNNQIDSLEDLRTELQAQIANAQSQYQAGDITKEELDAQINEAWNYFNTRATEIQRLSQTLMGMSASTVDLAQQLYETTDFDILDDFSESALSAVTQVGTMGELIQSTADATTAFIEASAAAIAEYEASITNLNQVVDSSMLGLEDYETYVSSFSDILISEAEESQHSIEAASEELISEFNQMATSALEFQQLYSTVLDNIIDGTETWVNDLETVLDIMNGLVGLNNVLNGMQNTTTTLASQTSSNISSLSGIASFDAGGYTGAWGSNGKLAVLHEEEAILNEGQTKDLFKMSDMLHRIDLQANLLEKGIGTLDSNKTAVPQDSNVIEQKIEIHADFPNATNHSEIEEAFDNLLNKATQYANRKAS